LASLKALAKQTVWYGVSNIAARFLTLLLTPFLTYTLSGPDGQLEYGKYVFIYSIIPILNVLYTYGMETSFFRFSTTEDRNKLYNTQLTSILLTTAFFSICLYLFRVPVAEYINVEDHVEYVSWCAWIIGLDTLAAIPYALLRKENRPRKYAMTKVAGIVVYVCSVVAMFKFGKQIPVDTTVGLWLNEHWGLGFILFANILQSIITLLLLSKELSMFRPSIDKELLKRILVYGFPILIAGFAGTINDTINRVMFQKMYPASEDDSIRMVGIYAAAVRLSILITLAVQAFKMAAEPFFFSISQDKNAPSSYARIMKWFVIILAAMFLNVMLYLDLWKYFVGGNYRDALYLVPVLLLANIFLGIYYNLTVWYKLTDKTFFGTYIMIIGSVVTLIFNWLLIPVWGYDACAWGTLLCYGIMMYLSYFWGQKYYPIPYDTGRIVKYLGVMLLLYGIQYGINTMAENIFIRLLTGTALYGLYFAYVYKKERTELKSLPVIGKYIR
jgi:O-antigen/teichoic acid export membrane protein